MPDATEHRMTITITPISEPDLQAFVDAFRERFGRKHLVHVIGKQPAGAHLAKAPSADEIERLRTELAAANQRADEAERENDRMRRDLAELEEESRRERRVAQGSGLTSR